MHGKEQHKCITNKVNLGLKPGEVVDGNKVYYIGANGAERRYTFTGSGLPFTNAEQAFYRTPNKGIAQVSLDESGGVCYVQFKSVPNSYYEGLGTYKVPPCIHLNWTSMGIAKTKRVFMWEEIPFRSLTYPPSGKFQREVMFYDNKDPFVKSQEHILLESAYPSLAASRSRFKEPHNFWGKRPPV